VLGDPEALRTLARNLVDNAVRYTPDGGRVDVSVESSEAGSDSALPAPSGPNAPEATQRPIILRVADNGPGIPPEERSRVLDRFYRRPGTAPPGSGLGMAIVKAIADTHDATLTLESGPDQKGLMVCVRFPAAGDAFPIKKPNKIMDSSPGAASS
jgi:two-component system, OmpR family, sensor kinase